MGETKEFKLPETSESVEESLVVFLYKDEGDFIKKGETLLEVQTEKAVFEIESPYSGVIKELFVKRGDSVAVNQLIATIDLTEESETAIISEEQKETTKNINENNSIHKAANSILASPRIKKIAKDKNIDLSEINGTGPGGKITEEDLNNYEKPATFSEANSELLDISNIRYSTAKKMMESLKNTAQLTETAKADVTLLSKRRKEIAPELTWTDWILRAVVLALEENPRLNSAWTEKGLKEYKNINLGIAVNVKEGLLVPVIKNAEALSISKLHNEINELVEKAQSQKLTKEEISGGTFTVTNLGSYGIQFFTPIINFPEAAILGVGKTETRLIMNEGEIETIEELPLSLTFDHRIIDGAPAAKFIQSLIKYLAEPEKLIE